MSRRLQGPMKTCKVFLSEITHFYQITRKTFFSFCLLHYNPRQQQQRERERLSVF